MDKYPGDVLAEIRKLRAEVDELRALLRQRDGLTSASAGWKIGNRTTPSAPASGGHLFANGGDPYWIDSGSIITPLITVIPAAASVTALTANSGTISDTINSVGGTYDQTALNNNFRSVSTKIN